MRASGSWRNRMENQLKGLICIVCPKGCHLKVDAENGYWVEGFGCPGGQVYGKKELINPIRVLTSIVKIDGGLHPCCPVKTDRELPKENIWEAMELIKNPSHRPGPYGRACCKKYLRDRGKLGCDEEYGSREVSVINSSGSAALCCNGWLSASFLPGNASG